MKTNYTSNIVSQTDNHLSDVLLTNKRMTENSLKMRAMAYLSQIKAQLLTETIYELNHDKKVTRKYLDQIEEKNRLLEKQKLIIEHQNEKLQKKIQIEKELLKHKEEILLQQAKLASMGDMVGNISHQWRQPLSIISTSASGLKLQKDFGILTDEILEETLDEITNNAKYLSETIDVFRNFIKERKISSEIILQDRINNALKIIGPSLKVNHIKIINDIDKQDPIKLNIILGELSQVLINIINNSIDAFKERKIEECWIKLDLKKYKEHIVLSIEDNAGGIPPEILPKIFEQYFTTKDIEHGTGLGLHMSKQIIINSFNGKINAKNTKKGVKFLLEIPVSIP